MDEAEQYDVWDLTPLLIPPRSTLYTPAPLGMGTPLVESLTSYMTRLAEAHSIFSGTLVQKMIVPLVPSHPPSYKQHGLFKENGERSTMFNGAGLPATYAVQALESLTLRTDLQHLTLLPLAAVLSGRARGLLRLTKAWCPTCYEQERQTSQVVYDPLLWAFQAVTSCPHHRQRLSTHCPYQNCARPLPGVGWRARVGYCSYCQRWLGQSRGQTEAVSVPQETDWSWQQWVTKELGGVLAFISNRSVLLERERVCQVVKHAVQQISRGELSAFARAVGMSRNMIDYWHQGKKVPEIDMLLRLCFRLQLSLCDFLFQEVDTLCPQLRDSGFVDLIVSKKKPLVQEEKVYQALEQVVASNEQPPPTLRMIASRIGHTPQILYRVHPAGCREIVARYRTYLRQQKEARLQRLQEEIRRIALQLRTEGISPTQKRIAPHLSQSGILRSPQVRQYLHEICQEVEAKR